MPFPIISSMAPCMTYRQSVAQKYVTYFFGTKALGSIIGAWQSTVLMEFYGNRGIFLFSSILPLAIMVFCSFFYDEYLEEEELNQVLPPIRESYNQLQQVVANLGDPQNVGFLTLVFLLTMTPAFSNLFNFYYTVELKFELATMSKISLAMSIAYFFSILVVNLLLRDRTFRKFFLATGFAYAMLNLSLLLIINKSFKWIGMNPAILCYILHSVNTFLQELNFLPLIGACCRLCPEDLESVSYSVFSGMYYFGTFISSIVAGILIKVVGITPKSYSGISTVIILQVVYQVVILSRLNKSIFPRGLELTNRLEQVGGQEIKVPGTSSEAPNSKSGDVELCGSKFPESSATGPAGLVSSGTGSHADIHLPGLHSSSDSSKIVAHIAAGIELAVYEDSSSKYKDK
jgi:BT1 family